MKTLVLTPTFTNKTSREGRGFITPPQHRQGGHPASAGGFYFGLIALVGAIQLKEVAIAKEGINHHNSNTAVPSFIRKESIL